MIENYDEALRVHRRKNRIGELEDMPDELDAVDSVYSGYRLVDEHGGFKFNGAYWRHRKLVAFRGAVLLCTRFGELHEKLILRYEDDSTSYRVITLDHFDDASGAELDNDLTRRYGPKMNEFLDVIGEKLNRLTLHRKEPTKW